MKTHLCKCGNHKLNSSFAFYCKKAISSSLSINNDGETYNVKGTCCCLLSAVFKSIESGYIPFYCIAFRRQGDHIYVSYTKMEENRHKVILSVVNGESLTSGKHDAIIEFASVNGENEYDPPTRTPPDESS